MLRKQIFKVIPAVILTILMLAGCTGNKNGGVETSVDEKPYQIDWFFVGDTQRDMREVEEKANEYLKDKINATLKLYPLDWSSIVTKVNVMIAGGEKFDICYGSNFQSNASKQAYLALDDLLDEYAPKTKQLLGEAFLNGARINGVLYGLPVNKDRGHHYGIVYRKDVAEANNIAEEMEAVKSLEDLEPMLEYIKENTNNILPFYPDRMVESLDFDKVISTLAFYPDSNDGKIINSIETPEYMEMAKLVHNLHQKGFTPPEGDMTISAIKDYFSSVTQLKPGKDKEMSTGTKEYAQIDLTKPRMMSKDVLGAIMAISRTSKDPEKVIKFMELMYTDKYLNNLIVFGIEDKHYEKVSENRIEVIPDSGYGFAPYRWLFGDNFIQFLTKGEDDNKVPIMQEYNKNLSVSNYIGFSFDPEAVKSEVGACANVSNEFDKIIFGGALNPEEAIPNYIEKLKRAGIETIKEEAQRQYNEWAEENK
jgi:putative aldouronate transport system substrate-binding protein